MPFLWTSFPYGKTVTNHGMYQATIPDNKKIAWPSPNKNRYHKCFAQSRPPFCFFKCITSIKRVSLFLLRKSKKLFHLFISKSQRAGMTLEAAIILPLFLFFFLNIASSIEMMRLHSNLKLALWETGSRMAVYGYAVEESGLLFGEEDSVLSSLAGMVLSHWYVRNEVNDYLGEQYLETSPLSYGADGLDLWESSFMEVNDCIDLIATYQVSGPFSIPGISSFRMATRYYGRAWTGYEISSQSETKSIEDYVYVAETGVVYHETKECSHLKLQIRSISVEELPQSKNAEGNSYTLCLLCEDEEPTDLLYITDFGERYHYNEKCSGLKRTIFTIRRTEAGAYRPCGRCAGT